METINLKQQNVKIKQAGEQEITLPNFNFKKVNVPLYNPRPLTIEEIKLLFKKYDAKIKPYGNN